jgi:ABC-2 type transport system permease protein
MKRKFKHYFKIWWMMSRNAFLTVIVNRLGFSIFFVGKLLRFFFVLFLIVFLLKGIKVLAGYNLDQTIFFFLVFNFIDTVSQFLFRETYRFRRLVVTGDLDLVLVKPINPLFRCLMGGADLIDLTTIPFLVGAMVIIGAKFSPAPLAIGLFVILLINGLLIATAFYISVMALGIITTEVDHTIMIYRDLSSLGRFPVDIYKQPLQTIITYFIPIGIMISFPAKALMGMLSFWGVIFSLVVGVGALFVSIRFWNFALKKYSSASS